MARMSSIPSVERSDSRSRISSDWDRAIVHSSWLNWAFTKESYAVARLLLRERSSPVEVRPGQTPAHSQPLIPYTTTRDTIARSPHTTRLAGKKAAATGVRCQTPDWCPVPNDLALAQTSGLGRPDRLRREHAEDLG
jgi:hypothetical protein